jgi:hypothetical protein
MDKLNEVLIVEKDNGSFEMLVRVLEGARISCRVIRHRSLEEIETHIDKVMEEDYPVPILVCMNSSIQRYKCFAL